jgi:magnesium-transporting ATPase (P-type)
MPNYETGELNSDYIFYYTDSSSGIIEIIKIFTGLFITFNTLIPISLMISNEVIKGLQVAFLNQDKHLAKFPDDKIKILSMKLHEDLGCVKYIFTDKTGTLTKNEMQFKACSIYTICFDEQVDEDTGLAKIVSDNKKSIFCNTLDVFQIISALINDIPTNIISFDNSPFSNYKQAITEFFLNIALNHNVLTEKNSDGNICYQGSNPDEVTLVTSAYELGVEFIVRSKNRIRIKLLNEEITYEIVQKFDFTSERKRSSIVVKDYDGNFKIYMKGSDNKIFENMDKFSIDNLYKITKDHIDSFAKRGLRTLCYSYKLIDRDEYYIWEKAYNEIKYKAISDKSLNKQVEETIAQLESNMILLGATALEDKLQDHVTTDIQEFIEAGINVWMITGDKLDTAESIGHSCKLFNDDTEVFRIKECYSVDEVVKRMTFVLDQMKAIKTEMEIKQWRTKKAILKKPRHEHHLETGIINEEEDMVERQKGKKKTEFEDFVAKNNIKIIENLDLNLRESNGRVYTETQFNNELEVILTPDNNNISKNNIKDGSVKKEPNDEKDETIDKIIIFKKETPSADDLRAPRLNNTITNRKSGYFNTDEKEHLVQHASDVNDASIIKFMVNNNYFEAQSSNNTFINKMIVPNNLQSLNVTKEPIVPTKKPSSYLPQYIINEEEEDKQLEQRRSSTAKLSKSRSKSVKLKELDANVVVNPELKKNSSFKDMFAYYQSKIHEIDKRKKTVYNFQFKTKKHKDKNESSDEEEQILNNEVNLMNFGLIIEGESIAHCLTERANVLFWKLMKKTRSIVACRCSPVLKAEIVSFVKKKSGEITLAIGDGGNDVNMIKVKFT